MTYQTVLLLKNVDLITQFIVTHFIKGEVEMPSDLARLCIKNKWAIPVKVLRTPNQKHNH